MARVDFFPRPNGELLVSEINTIPGFTGISICPRFGGASRIPYAELLDRLIRLALERPRSSGG
jgi:D-alanine-D-alanine ligase